MRSVRTSWEIEESGEVFETKSVSQFTIEEKVAVANVEYPQFGQTDPLSLIVDQDIWDCVKVVAC